MKASEILNRYCREEGLPEPSYKIIKGQNPTTGRTYYECVCIIENNKDFIPGNGSAYEAEPEDMCCKTARKRAAEKVAADAEETAIQSAAAAALRNNGLDTRYGWGIP